MDKPDPLKKTVAIVFCDIAGFGRLNAAEGDLVAARVLRTFYEHADQLAKENQCLTIKFIGDAVLATFGDIHNVMPFISSIRDLLTQDAVLSRWRLACTFSLDFGAVLFVETSYGPDVIGEQINIAAHLNELAQPHQLVLSQAALDKLPRDQQARAGPTETHSLKRGGAVEFHRIDLTVS